MARTGGREAGDGGEGKCDVKNPGTVFDEKIRSLSCRKKKFLNIGFLPGSFSPLHSGHLFLAKRAAMVGRLDCVLFYINSFNKEKNNLLPWEERYEKIDRVCATFEKAIIPRSFYTDTPSEENHNFLELIAKLRHEIGFSADLYIIRGSDYFSKPYPEGLRQLPHLIGCRNKADMRNDFSVIKSYKLFSTVCISSTSIRKTAP